MAKKDITIEEFKELRDSAISAVNDGYNYRTAVSVDDLEEAFSYPRWTVSTGLDLLDAAIGGGFMEGKIARWFGPSAGGKTSLLYHSVGQAMNIGAQCIYFDTELAFDADRCKHLTVARGLTWSPERMTIVYPDHLEDMFEQLALLLSQFHPVPKSSKDRPEFKQPLMVFMDTISQCPTKYEFELVRVAKGEISEAKGGGMSSRARTIKMEMRKIRKPLAIHGASLLVTEQEIASLNQYGPSTTTSGGGGLPYGCDQGFRVKQSTAFQDADSGKEAGHIVSIKTEKTRHCPPRSHVEIPLYYDKGFDNLESLFNFCSANGLIQKEGKFFVMRHTATAEELKSGQPLEQEVKFYPKNWRENLTPEPWNTRLRELALKNVELIWVGKKK